MIQNTSRQNTYLVIGFSVFLIALTVLSVGSFDSRLANSIGDDHPMIWARFFFDQKFWREDAAFSSGLILAKASLPNLLAALATRWNEHLPRILSWLYVLIQNLGLGLSLFAFCKALKVDQENSILVTLLCFVLAPWGLNLTYYPSMMYSPYPGHLVMPFLVLAAIYLVQKHIWKMIFTLMIAGLIHPSQALHFLVLAAVYILLTARKSSIKTILLLGLPALSCLIIPFVLIGRPENPLTDLELISSALKNPHLVPWSNNIFWPWGVPTMVMIFWLSYLAVKTTWREKSSVIMFWWANVISFSLLGLLHFVGVYFRVLPIIVLCPLRITVINSVLLTPLIFVYLISLMKTESRAVAFNGGTVLGLLLSSKRGLFWGPLMILSWATQNKNPDKMKIKVALAGIAWWVIFLLAGRPLRYFWSGEISGTLRNILAPGSSFTILSILGCLGLAIGLTWYKALEKKYPKKASVLPLLVVSLIGIVQSYNTGKEINYGSNKANYELQKWAYSETAKESIFLMRDGSWRGISERRMVPIAFGKDRLLPYLRTREPLVWTARLEGLYSKFGIEKFDDLTPEQILSFAKELKGNYLVDSKCQTPKNLPLAYENEFWKVYRLN